MKHKTIYTFVIQLYFTIVIIKKRHAVIMVNGKNNINQGVVKGDVTFDF